MSRGCASDSASVPLQTSTLQVSALAPSSRPTRPNARSLQLAVYRKLRARAQTDGTFAPAISTLKQLKGVDDELLKPVVLRGSGLSVLRDPALQELAAQSAERERLVWRATLPVSSLSTKPKFLAQVTEPQVLVNAS
jgi:hypothetical protein